jgi:hypothetical protein
MILFEQFAHFDILAAKTGTRYQQLLDNPVDYTSGIKQTL